MIVFIIQIIITTINMFIYIHYNYHKQGDEVHLTELREMYEKWPFFRETIDLIAMTLSKANSDIAQNYEKQLLIDPNNSDLSKLGDELRENLDMTRNSILQVTSCEDLSRLVCVCFCLFILRMFICI